MIDRAYLEQVKKEADKLIADLWTIESWFDEAKNDDARFALDEAAVRLAEAVMAIDAELSREGGNE